MNDTTTRRFTDWDVMVLGAIVLSLMGWTVTIVVGLDPASADWTGFGAAIGCQIAALAALIYAFRM